MERFSGAVRAVLKSEPADVQGVLPMKLGGFEPPTSWVRFKSVVLLGNA
jgi:hypothetical protein